MGSTLGDASKPSVAAAHAQAEWQTFIDGLSTAENFVVLNITTDSSNGTALAELMRVDLHGQWTFFHLKYRSVLDDPVMSEFRRAQTGGLIVSVRYANRQADGFAKVEQTNVLFRTRHEGLT